MGNVDAKKCIYGNFFGFFGLYYFAAIDGGSKLNTPLKWQWNRHSSIHWACAYVIHKYILWESLILMNGPSKRVSTKRRFSNYSDGIPIAEIASQSLGWPSKSVKFCRNYSKIISLFRQFQAILAVWTFACSTARVSFCQTFFRANR